MHHILFYDVVDDYVNRRAPFRGQHLEKVQQAYQRGELVLGGALADPPDQAVLVFRDSASAEDFAKTDPYVTNGLVSAWRVRKWTTVVGDGAVPPAAVAGSSRRPDPSEYPSYAAAYVDLVVGDNILQTLASQIEETLALLRPIEDSRATALTYAPGKWTLKQVLGHMIDTERIFAYRALRVARSDTTPLPGFEEADYVRAANHNEHPLSALLDEFRVVRQGTLILFQNLPAEAWQRRGVVNRFNVSVRGLAFVTAGHELHHVKILREKYLR